MFVSGWLGVWGFFFGRILLYMDWLGGFLVGFGATVY